MSGTKQNIFRVLATLALAAAPAFASPITVANFSFEELPVGGLPFGACGAGCFFSVAPIPGWTGGGPRGQFQPGTQLGNTAHFSSLASDGSITHGFSSGGTLSQVVLPTVVVGEIYTLLVDIGNRNDAPFTGTARLLIGSAPVAAIGVTPLNGAWGTFTASYFGVAGDVGKSITIELVSAGSQANFDNVRLDGTAPSGVPEPASFLLIGPALLAISLRLKRIVKA